MHSLKTHNGVLVDAESGEAVDWHELSGWHAAADAEGYPVRMKAGAQTPRDYPAQASVRQMMTHWALLEFRLDDGRWRTQWVPHDTFKQLYEVAAAK